MSTSRRMVVVDDDPKVRLLLERAFKAPEFETYTFATGSAALAHMSTHLPDCIVSDILMPDMDGEAFLRNLRGQAALEHVPFVALSAVRSEARIQSVLEAGASAFLVKPFPLRDLVEKVRSLVDRPADEPPVPDKPSDYASPTGPVYAAAHTMSTAALPKRAHPESGGPPVVRVGGPIRVVVPTPAAPRPPTPLPSPAAPAPALALAPGVGAADPPSSALPAERAGVRHIELQPKDSVGFGRFTRVETRGRAFVVLTEAVPQPKFTVTTVITERGVPLRKLESALPHPLAREDDQATVRRQVDLQHDGVLEGLDHVVLEQTPRRVVWSDQSRSVEAGLLAWAMSAVAQLAESEAGTEETKRLLELTRERVGIDAAGLRAFHVTAHGRVIVNPDHGGRLARRAVSAVAAWCLAFATAALQADAETVAEPIRQATRRHAVELERLGFYERLQRKVRA